jgi:hypothetical protein
MPHLFNSLWLHKKTYAVSESCSWAVLAIFWSSWSKGIFDILSGVGEVMSRLRVDVTKVRWAGHLLVASLIATLGHL